MTDQTAKAIAFRDLHDRPEPFLLPNPWDAGSVRLLADLGFPALATTSLGVAVNHGKARASADEIIENCRVITAATDLPVNADLENGYADDPEEAAKMIARAYEAGVVGASIEDATGDRAKPIYDFDLAVARVAAAVEAARALPQPFMLTARAEGLLYRVHDLDEIIRRLQAFEAVGADVLYAPALMTTSDMRTVVDSVGKPVNVVMGLSDPNITLAELAEAGVRRVSIGGAFSRAVLQLLQRIATEMKDGRFTFANDLMSVKELRRIFPDGQT